MAMSPINLRVRCMAWQEQGLWVAACIDFTLAAQAATLAEVKADLHAQIGAYVNEAIGIDAEHAEQLLERSAPLRDRARFAFWKMVSRRPRLRRAAGRAVAVAGLALRRKLAWIEPLPLHA